MKGSIPVFLCAFFVSALGLVCSAQAAEPVSGEKILVVAPHEDDEMLAFGGIMRQALIYGDELRVVVVSNGDAEGGAEKGKTRIAETTNALLKIGVPREAVIFLGYGDTGWAVSGLHTSFMGKLYQSTDPEKIYSSHVGSSTYGNPAIGKDDYHFTVYGEHGAYNRATLLGDLQRLINEYRPDRIYTTSIYDYHWGHKATGLFTNEAVVNIKRGDPSYSPILGSSIIHAMLTNGSQDNNWPKVITDPDATLESFTPPGDLHANSPLEWSDRITVPAPVGMDQAPLSGNLKYQALQLYQSQLGSTFEKNFLASYVKSDEFYWEKDYSNIALCASVTVSSENTGTGQTGEKAIDGVTDGNPRFPDKEWVTAGEGSGAWIQLNWEKEHEIDRIALYDRPNSVEWVQGLDLTFSDGTTLAVGALPNNGKAKIVSFPSKRVTWVRATINKCQGMNIGLAEFEVYERGAQLSDPGENLALEGLVNASSMQNEGYSAIYACDGGYDTRWASKTGETAWICVDLLEQKPIKRIVLNWEKAYAKDFDIETSSDGRTWEVLANVTGAGGGEQEYQFENAAARYVRISCKSRGTIYGYSLWEFQIY